MNGCDNQLPKLARENEVKNLHYKVARELYTNEFTVAMGTHHATQNAVHVHCGGGDVSPPRQYARGMLTKRAWRMKDERLHEQQDTGMTQPSTHTSCALTCEVPPRWLGGREDDGVNCSEQEGCGLELRCQLTIKVGPSCSVQSICTHTTSKSKSCYILIKSVL